MGIAISNYNVKIGNADVPTAIKDEDERLMRKARKIVKDNDFGKGAIIISEVFHTNVPTSNGWAYQSKKMNSSIKSFYEPAMTPFLMHHNDGKGDLFSNGDRDLVSVGTNLLSMFVKRTTEMSNGRGISDGYGKVATFINKDIKINDTSVIDLIQSRNLLQLSSTSRTTSSNYVCSICEKPYRSEDCNHKVFQRYETEDGNEKLCYIKLFSPRFLEYSAVYDPADVDAQIRRMETMDSEGGIVENGLLPSSDHAHISFYDSYEIPVSTNIPQGDSSMDEKAKLSLEELKQIRDFFSQDNAQVLEMVKSLKDEFETLKKEISDSTSTDTNTDDGEGDTSTDKVLESISQLSDQIKTLSDKVAVLEETNSDDDDSEEDDEDDDDSSDSSDSSAKNKKTKTSSSRKDWD